MPIYSKIKPDGWNEIGRLGENEHRVIQFPESRDMFGRYPEAEVTVLHKRPEDQAAYPVDPAYVRVIDGIVEWTIRSGDLKQVGKGRCELVFKQDGVIAKTLIYPTRILPALDDSEDPPEPWEGWATRILEAARRIETETSDLRNDFDDLGLSVVDGEINITFEEEAGE